MDDETVTCSHCGRGYASLSTPEERAVINKALDWEVLYRARTETWPEDDDLHFALERLIESRNPTAHKNKL